MESEKVKEIKKALEDNKTDHLYLLNAEQLAHLIKLQTSWQTSYDDDKKNEIIKEYEE